MHSTSIVILGPAYGTPLAVTPSDTVNNLRMDSITAGYLQNKATTAVTVAILYSSNSTAQAATIPAGGALQLSPHALRVMSTGTDGGASLEALF